ncbi:MAG: arsenate reductase ArsC [Bryobacteraceae bacterium]
MKNRKKRVLFVCVGNACRSQMAEAFARAYGSDVMIPASAGLAPAPHVAPDTLLAMQEKNLDLRHQFPKAIRHLRRSQFDFVVNMAGIIMPLEVEAPVRYWNVDDPVSMSYEDHCAVRDEIERLVMQLVLELRREPVPVEADGQEAGSE